MRNSSRSAPEARSTYDNLAAVAEFITRAHLLSPQQWRAPRAPGKWAPYQEARHLVLTHQLFTDALLGRGDIDPHVSEEKAQRLYAAVMPGIMNGGPLPTGGESPKAADPTLAADLCADAERSADSLLQELDLAVQAFQKALETALVSDPERRVRHPYFGLLSLEEVAAVNAAHTRHHAAFLPPHTSPA